MDTNGLIVSTWIAHLGIWPLVLVLIPNLLFRKYGQSAGRKRMSSLFQAIAVFAITTVAAFISEKQLSDKYLFGIIILVGVVLYVFRQNVFPYKINCVACDAKLDFKTIYFMDDNLCSDCHSKKATHEETEHQGVADEATDVTSGHSPDHPETDHSETSVEKEP